MPLFNKSVLKPEGSVMAGLAVMGVVFANYQLNAGTVASAQATDPNHPVLNSSRKKAGYTSLILVSGIGLIARDANILVLGFASIIGMEAVYRHGIMAHPQTGQIVVPDDNATYQPAENVTPLYNQADVG